MRDRREEILARLVVIGSVVGGFSTVARNEDNIPGLNRPAYVVLDGDEETNDSDEGYGRPSNKPEIVWMSAEIVLLLGKSASAVGTDLNTNRRVVISTIKNDASLRSSVGTNGEIRYAGLGSEFASGRTMEGEMRLSFRFKYLLIVSELT